MPVLAFLKSPRLSENIRFALLVGLFALCLLFGGSSFHHAFGAVVVESSAVIAATLALLLPGPVRLREIRAPLLLLAAFALTMLVQLVPLPPGIWTNLPGHAPFANTATVAGIAQPWRPISLTPDLTHAALAALAVPAAVLVLFAAVPAERTYGLLPYLIAGVVLSAMLGAAQVTAGQNGPLYLYENATNTSAVGFFSNRNHQAVWLLAAIPMLIAWVKIARFELRGVPLAQYIAGAILIALVPALLMAGSRAGLALSIVAIFFAWLIGRDSRRPSTGRAQWSRLLPIVAIAGVGVIVLALAVLMSRAEAISRLFENSVTGDLRSTNLGLVLRIAVDFFPFGSGYGSFDPVFRFYEPVSLLKPTYFNHAHNDPLELLLTGGLPAVLVGLAFVAWASLSGWRVFRSVPVGLARRFALVGLSFVTLLLLSSVVDYPLRTPMMSAVFALGCAWLAAGAKPTMPGRNPR